ncbi:MAG: DUF642 domain-containing protein [Aureispira sp.]
MTKRLFLPIFILLQAWTLSAQDNLIKNGQFTEGTQYWEVLLVNKDNPIKAHIEHGDSYKEYGLADNFIGTNFVELDQESALQQNITTVPGKRYKLMFAYAHRPEAGKKQFIVMAAGRVVFTKTLDNGALEGHFSYKEIEFTAKSAQTKIGFHAATIAGSPDDKGVLLTDVLCKEITTEALDLHEISSGGKI